MARRKFAVGVTLCAVLFLASAAARHAAAQTGAFSTYLGGSGLEVGQTIATDAAGNLYVAGYTSSPNFAPVNAAGTFKGGGLLGSDAFLARFNPDGSLAFATLIGGSGDESLTAIAVDASGRVYAAGITTSADLPISGSIHPYRGGRFQQTDGFVVRFSADGSGVEAGTYLGGSGDEMIGAIALGAAGTVHVAGTTTSPDLPTSFGAAQPRHAGGLALDSDAFVAGVAFGESAASLEYLTYLGGRFDETATAIALRGENTVVAGFTNSTDFPTASPLQGSFAGPMRPLEGDVFVVELDSLGSQLWMSTFLGGSGDDQATSLAIDSADGVLVSGWTASSDFPVTGNAWQPARAGGRDAFVVRLLPTTGTWSIDYATYVGGSGDDLSYSVAAATSGLVVVGGRSSSADLPVRGAVQSALAGGRSDAFVARLSTDGSALDFATYLGGAGTEALSALVVADSSRVCATGGTGSADFVLADASQTTFDGVGDASAVDLSAFVACFGPGDFATSTEAPLSVPGGFSLHPNFPNPFSSTTTVGFDLPAPGRVTLDVFDLLGRRVAIVLDGDFGPGRYQAAIDARAWAAGLYIYRIRTPGFVKTREMIVVR